MANQEPPFPPLILVLLGAIACGFGVAIALIDSEGAVAKALMIGALTLGGPALTIGLVAAGVELGVRRANFRR